MNIQAPPNLSPGVYRAADRRRHQRLGRRLAGDARSRQPRSAVAADRGAGAATRAATGKVLVQRLPVYPAYVARRRSAGSRRTLRTRVLPRDRRRGLGARRRLGAGPHRCRRRRAAPMLRDGRSARSARIVDRAIGGRAARRGRDRRGCSPRAAPTIDACHRARPTRCARRSAATSSRYVVNRNINYTNICYLPLPASARSPRASTHDDLRGTPYDLALDEVVAARRARPGSAAPPKSACRAASIPTTPARPTSRSAARSRRRVPDMHVHAFSPLEVTQGAATLGLSLRRLPGRAEGGRARHAARHRGGDPRRRGARRSSARTRSTPRSGSRCMRDRAPARAAHHLDHHVRPRRDGRCTGRAICCALRDLQAETGGFTEFVPLPFVHMEAPMYLQRPRAQGADLARGGADARGGAARAASADPQHPDLVGEDGAGRRRGLPERRRQRSRRHADEREHLARRRHRSTARSSRPRRWRR